MPFKPSEMFIRALDDAEVRPDPVNAQMVNDPNANPASRLGALIDLSKAEQAKRRARSQAPQGAGTVADKIVSSFIQSQANQPTAEAGIGSGLAGVIPQPAVPGFSNGGIFDEEVMGRLMGLGIPPSVIASGIGMTPGQVESIQEMRDLRRENIFTGDEYQPQAAEVEERKRLKGALGIPLSLQEIGTAFVDARGAGREAGESLSGIPGDIARALEFDKFPAYAENVRDTISTGDISAMEFGALPGEVSPGNEDIPEGLPEGLIDTREKDLYDKLAEQEEASPGMSNLQRAMLLLSAAQGFSAPVRPGESTIGNLARELGKGTRLVAADEIAREKVRSQDEFRRESLSARSEKERRNRINSATRLAYEDMKLQFPQANKLGPPDEEEQKKMQDYLDERTRYHLSRFSQPQGSASVPDLPLIVSNTTRLQ